MAAYQYIYVMKGLSKTYPGGREVLKDIWLSFLPGAKIGVLGPNGAGKSTLLRIMAGDERAFAGEDCAAGSGAASHCAGFCCSGPICCGSTSRRTISTPNRSPGCSAFSKTTPGPS